MPTLHRVELLYRDAIVAYDIDIRKYSSVCVDLARKPTTSEIFTVLEFSLAELLRMLASGKVVDDEGTFQELLSQWKTKPDAVDEKLLPHLASFRKFHEEGKPISRVILSKQKLETWFAKNSKLFDFFMALNGGMACYLGFRGALAGEMYGLQPFLSDHAIFVDADTVTLVDYYTDAALLKSAHGNLVLVRAEKKSVTGEALLRFHDNLGQRKWDKNLYCDLNDLWKRRGGGAA
jgi:hypothetical protein